MILSLMQRLSCVRILPSLYHQHCHHKRLFTSSSVKHTGNSVNSGDTFGCLAIKNKEKYSKDKESTTSSDESSQSSRNFSKPYQGSLKSHKDVSYFSPDNMLKKWQHFRRAQDQEYQKVLISLGESQQDDAEEDYHLFMSETSVRSQGRENTPNSINERKKSHQKITKSTADASDGLRPPQELPEGEAFGKKLNPTSEEAEGDEGDREEEKYQQAKHERRHRPQYYGKRMMQLCQERKLAEAIKILEKEMPSVAAKPNDFCYQVLINACGRAGYTKKAFQLYNQMKQRGLNIEPVAYTGLFNACANSPWPTTDGLQRATKLRMQLKEKGILFNQIVSHAMIKAFGWCGDIGTAFLVVDEMVDDGVLVTTETINFLLQACITDKEAGFRHAVKVWRKMRQLKLRPDLYSYNLLMRVIKECDAGDPSLTSFLLQEERDIHKPTINDSSRKQLLKPETVDIKEPLLPHQNHPMDVLEEATHPISKKNTVMQRLENGVGECVLPNILGKKMSVGDVVALGALDKPQDRLALLGGPTGIVRQMVKDRVTPNLKTFTQLLDCMPEDTTAELALVESMKNIGLEPDTQFFNMLIKRRNFSGNTKAAQEVITLMQEYHLIPDLTTYGCLALGCHSIRSATQLLKDMDASQFRPNIQIMTCLVKNSLVKQDYAFTLTMMKEMQQRGTVPDDFLLSVMEKARAQARKSLLEKDQSKIRKQGERRVSAEMFLAAYKEWLTGSQVQLPEHPWTQYR